METMKMEVSVQDIPALASQPAPVAVQPLDDAAVRQAIANAEAQGIDPERLRVSDLSQGQQVVPSAPVVAEVPRPDVPEKFMKSNGEVDVEKLKASTIQLDEAIAKKEAGLQEVQKTVDDYLRDYQEKEAKFRSTPNPERIAAQLPPVQPPPDVDPARMSDSQLQDLINRDMQTNPAATVTQLIELALQRRFAPIEQREKVNSVRDNISQLATKDPRVLQPQVYTAIKKELNDNPKLWNLDNPHEFAWLKVKERLQLGEAGRPQAQPSKAPSPILGGGTPPPPPLVAGSGSLNDPASILNRADLRDPKQEAMGDAALRQLLALQDRW